MAEVLQCDRDAAAELIEARYALDGVDAGRLQTPNETRMGDRDHCPEVQHFAAHRGAAEKAERQAVVTWLRDMTDEFEKAAKLSGMHQLSKPIETLREVAAAIERGDHRKG